MKKKSMMTYAKASSIPIYKYPMKIFEDFGFRDSLTLTLQMIPSLAAEISTVHMIGRDVQIEKHIP